MVKSRRRVTKRKSGRKGGRRLPVSRRKKATKRRGGIYVFRDKEYKRLGNIMTSNERKPYNKVIDAPYFDEKLDGIVTDRPHYIEDFEGDEYTADYVYSRRPDVKRTSGPKRGRTRFTPQEYWERAMV